MRRYVVGDLVTEDGGEGVGVAADANDAAEDEEIASRGDEGIGSTYDRLLAHIIAIRLYSKTYDHHQ